MNIFKKFLNKKLSDRDFKLIFLGSIGIVLFSISILISNVKTLKEKQYNLQKQQSVVILDESGNVYNKLIHSDLRELSVLFGLSYIKQLFSLDFAFYNKNFNYLRKYSTSKVFNQILKNTKTSIKELKIIHGGYKSFIENFIIEEKDNKSFDMICKISQKLFSEGKKEKEKKFLVKISLQFSEPSESNSSGIFVNKLSYTKFKHEEHEEIFAK